jgi:hypothetical protein
MQLSLFGGTFLKLDKNGVPRVDEDDDERLRPRTKSPWSAEVRGFNRHAGAHGRVRSSTSAWGPAGRVPEPCWCAAQPERTSSQAVLQQDRAGPGSSTA